MRRKQAGVRRTQLDGIHGWIRLKCSRYTGFGMNDLEDLRLRMRISNLEARLELHQIETAATNQRDRIQP